MADMKFTPAQQHAIDARVDDLLVSAAAGSGKTRVLVERLLNQVEEGASVNEFLIITFTKAAGAELKGRILEALAERQALRPSKHLARQSALVYGADIGTIHAFCGKIIREFAHKLDQNATFRQIDDLEGKTLKRETIETIIEARYAGMEAYPGFEVLVDLLSQGRRDEALLEVTLNLHEKFRSHADPQAFAKTCLEELEVSGKKDAKETIWGAYLMAQAKARASYWLRSMQEAETAFDDAFQKGYGNSWNTITAWLTQFVKACDQSWDAVHAAKELPKESGRVKGEGYETFKSLRERCRKEIKELGALFAESAKSVLEDIANTKPATQALLSLVEDLDRAYTAAKTRRACLDFSDLEHLAYKLLVDQNSKAPSEAAGEIAARYKEVMIDEFQDVSGIQDALFKALSECGTRRFMVGDVKQSIYRFRLADPSIFRAYYKKFSLFHPEDETGGRKVLLGKNFRSHPEILSAVNFLFRHLMSESFGEMQYGDDEALYPGKEHAQSPEQEARVQLDVLDLQTLPAGEARDLAEARHVANEIAKLQKEQNYRFQDFAILLRSVKKAERFARALEEHGIPVAKSGDEAFFYTEEVASFMSLLFVITNPRQDVPLLSVLRSPLYGFSPDRLAEIRITDRSGSFYEALRQHAEKDTVSRKFLDDLSGYRALATDMPCDIFLWKLLRETHTLTIFGAKEDGEMRCANIMALVHLAEQSGGGQTLFDFVKTLEKRVEYESKPKVAGAGSVADAVQIMSIHKSKGLEFPVVFLPDLAKKINTDDYKKHVLIHPELSIGSIYRDLERRIWYSTLPHEAIKQRLKIEAMSEELRCLYVAMTRAEERLIMTVTIDNAEKKTDGKTKLQTLAEKVENPIPPQLLSAESSVGNWILLASLLREDAGAIRSGAELPIQTTATPWNIRLIPCTEKMADETKKDKSDLCEPLESVEIDETFRRYMEFSYPHQIAENLPSKITATQIKGRVIDEEIQAEAVALQTRKRPLLFRKPEFIEEARPLTAAQKGTATHLVMQYIRYEACKKHTDVQAEIARLIREERIGKREGEAVDTMKIWNFFQTPLGVRLRENKTLVREFKFSVLAKAHEIGLGKSDESLLLQGVVDAYFEENDGITVLDFKTDIVAEENLEEHCKSYHAQLAAYAHALGKITGKPVKEVLLYFFHPACEVKIKLDELEW